MRFESNKEMLDYLFSLRHMNVKLGLESITGLMDFLGHPEKAFDSIHVAGTNGKGSTCAILASIYPEAGYKTGLYTSPHLVDLRERIQINGEMISLDFVRKMLNEMLPAIKSLGSSFFEVITAIAFSYFCEQSVEMAVVEVGMGGRLDATNVLYPKAVVITEIDLDHQKQLGNDPKQISQEKAGIIKPGATVIVNVSRPEVLEHLSLLSREKRTAFVFARKGVKVENVRATPEGTSFSLRTPQNHWDRLFLPLPGRYQIQNAMNAIRTVETLGSTDFEYPKGAIPRGLRNVHWPGRLQLLQSSPTVIADVAHNLHGISHAIDEISNLFPRKRITCVFGVLAEKDYLAMIELLNEYVDDYIAVSPDQHRALSAVELTKAIHASGKNAIAAESVLDGLETAITNSNSDDVVCILGSHYNLENVLKHYKSS